MINYARLSGISHDPVTNTNKIGSSLSVFKKKNLKNCSNKVGVLNGRKNRIFQGATRTIFAALLQTETMFSDKMTRASKNNDFFFATFGIGILLGFYKCARKGA